MSDDDSPTIDGDRPAETDLSSLSLTVNDDGAFDRAQDMLRAAGVDPEQIREITVEVAYVPTADMPSLDEIRTRMDESDDEPDVDIGPNMPSPDGTPRHHNGSDEYYEGKPRKEETVGTHTKAYTVLKELERTTVEEDEWLTANALADRVDVSAQSASTVLSKAHNDRGFTQRRKIDQPDGRGWMYEYQIIGHGRDALKLGEELAIADEDKEMDEPPTGSLADQLIQGTSDDG